MLIIIISRSNLKLGHVGSKTRLLGQQATQVSDLGPLWPSCYVNPFPHQQALHFGILNYETQHKEGTCKVLGRSVVF